MKIIDIISARLDAQTDSYLATLPSLRLNNVRLSPELVNAHQRLLTGGFYAETELEYDPAIATQKAAAPLVLLDFGRFNSVNAKFCRAGPWSGIVHLGRMETLSD